MRLRHERMEREVKAKVQKAAAPYLNTLDRLQEEQRRIDAEINRYISLIRGT
jgi:hypothetical protein